MDVAKWWRSLDGELQQKLMADPFGPVPADVVPAMVGKEAPGVTAAWWQSMQEGPDGFRLPHQVQEFIEGQRLWANWQEARAAHGEFLKRYFGIADGDMPVVMPEEHVTAAVLNESEGLARAEEDARSAWAQHRRRRL